MEPYRLKPASRRGRVTRLAAIAVGIALTSASYLGADPQEPVREEMDRARDLIRTGEHLSADALLRELLANHPDHPGLLLARGELLLLLGRTVEARGLLERCARIAPDRPRVHFQLGAALSCSGETEGALAAYQEEINLNSDPRVRRLAHFNRSILFQEQRRWSDAARELEAIVSQRPHGSEATVYGDLSAVYVRAGSPDQAFEALMRGERAGFCSSNHLVAVGRLYAQLENWERAVAVFGHALDGAPDDPDARRELGLALERLGRAAEASHHLKRYLELRPDAPDSPQIRRRVALRADSG